MAERRWPKLRQSYEFTVWRASKPEKRVLSQAWKKICQNNEHKASKRESESERERGWDDKWKDYDSVVLLVKLRLEFGYPVSDTVPSILLLLLKL